MLFMEVTCFTGLVLYSNIHLLFQLISLSKILFILVYLIPTFYLR